MYVCICIYTYIRVECASDGTDAVRLVVEQGRKFDIILIDQV
jgi:hypothetical protein